MASLPAGSHTVSLRHEGRERPYLLHVPPVAFAERVPLLLELHGRGIDPVSFDRWTGFRHLADRAGFVVALPSAVGEIWNDGRYPALARDGPRDVGYLVALIEDACTRLPIDMSRIYVVGMSNGATMAARLACEQAGRIAAFAQVAGTAAVRVAAGHGPACPVPILQIHGTGDDTAPYGGGGRRGLRARLMIRRAAGPSIGVDDWARFWVEANDAHEGPRIETIPPDTTVRGGVVLHPPPTSSSTGSTTGVTPGPATASRCRASSSVGRAAPSTRRRSSGTSFRPTTGRRESSKRASSEVPVHPRSIMCPRRTMTAPCPALAEGSLLGLSNVAPVRACARGGRSASPARGRPARRRIGAGAARPALDEE